MIPAKQNSTLLKGELRRPETYLPHCTRKNLISETSGISRLDPGEKNTAEILPFSPHIGQKKEKAPT